MRWRPRTPRPARRRRRGRASSRRGGRRPLSATTRSRAARRDGARGGRPRRAALVARSTRAAPPRAGPSTCPRRRARACSRPERRAEDRSRIGSAHSQLIPQVFTRTLRCRCHEKRPDRARRARGRRSGGVRAPRASRVLPGRQRRRRTEAPQDGRPGHLRLQEGLGEARAALLPPPAEAAAQAAPAAQALPHPQHPGGGRTRPAAGRSSASARASTASSQPRKAPEPDPKCADDYDEIGSSLLASGVAGNGGGAQGRQLRVPAQVPERAEPDRDHRRRPDGDRICDPKCNLQIEGMGHAARTC